MSARVTCLGVLIASLLAWSGNARVQAGGGPFEARLGNELPGALKTATHEIASMPIQGPTGITYALYYNNPATGKWAYQKNSTDLRALHNEGKGKNREYRDYHEPPNRANSAPTGTAMAMPMNYTIVPFPINPNIPIPVIEPEYGLWSCVGSGWVLVNHTADYNQLFNQIPGTGILVDCSEGCPGGNGLYYKICPYTPPPPAPYPYHTVEQKYPIAPVAPTKPHRFFHRH